MNRKDVKLGMKLSLRHFFEMWDEHRTTDCVVVGFSTLNHPIVEIDDLHTARTIIVTDCDNLFPRLREVIWWARAWKDTNGEPRHTGFYRNREDVDSIALPSGAEWIDRPYSTILMEPIEDE